MVRVHLMHPLDRLPQLLGGPQPVVGVDAADDEDAVVEFDLSLDL